MAGGSGARLGPYTATLPKPLLPLGGGHTLLGVIMHQLARAGVRRGTVALGHRAEVISAYFGDGARWGLALDYVVEAKPLGTVGPLSTIGDLPEDFLLVNCDILCDLDHAALLTQHLASGNDVTLAVCRRHIDLAYGVVDFDARGRVTGFTEKPRVERWFNMGVYALGRRVLAHLPMGSPCGADTLVQGALARGERVGVVPFEGFWKDVGTPEDYEWVNAHWLELEPRLLR